MTKTKFFKKQISRAFLFFQIILDLLIIGKLNAQESYHDYALTKNPVSDNNKLKLAAFEFKAYILNYDLAEITKEMSGENLFGDIVAKKLFLLEKKYTYEVAISPGNPQTKNMIRKPLIFNAVRQIERHLKKCVKKEKVSIESASLDFNKVLDVALNILTCNTQDFEETLKKTKEMDERIDLFTRRVTLVY